MNTETVAIQCELGPFITLRRHEPDGSRRKLGYAQNVADDYTAAGRIVLKKSAFTYPDDAHVARYDLYRGEEVVATGVRFTAPCVTVGKRALIWTDVTFSSP